MNLSKVTVKTFTLLQKLYLKENAVLLKFLCIKELKKKISSTTIFNIDNEKCYIIE